MVGKPQPVLSDSKSRNARYYISDNFLKAWLAVTKLAREAARLKPMEKALAPALRRLETLEGFASPEVMRTPCDDVGPRDSCRTAFSGHYTPRWT